ncbi:hypothetical protein GPECTOR_136g642 [Gonium pectorale]|uniref:Uncharacterized protein n=1 Tax=Gonium pectorale TaxID=33097 RepID=A0A150FY81_GONPE|nr:hypothetical protein GPECTOR_136g642 [Gonium pectorale]|eukprot:KXZ42559.1 hypothetical protein GPECTOR_136g642 [Gonium pectorale]
MLAKLPAPASGLKPTRPAAASRSVRLPCRALLATPGVNGSTATLPPLQAPAQPSPAPAQESLFIDTRTWEQVNLTRATLMELQGIPLQGFNLTISYEPSADELIVIDYAKGLRFPAVFGPDNKVRVDITGPVPTAVIGLSFEALSQVLRADSAAAELVNGRAAMVGVFLGLFGEVMNDDIIVRQLFTTEGAYNAMLVGALVLAASVAPAILGRVPVQNVFPDEENPPPMTGDLPNVWNYNAERLNGRVAMVGFLGLMVSEMLSERQCGLVTKVLSDWGNWSC